MQITIDTKRDSRDDIVKVIKFLKHVIGDSSPEVFSNKPRNIFEDSSSFGGSSSPSPLSSLSSSPEPQQSAPAQTGMFNMFDNPQPQPPMEPETKEEESQEKPQIQLY